MAERIVQTENLQIPKIVQLRKFQSWEVSNSEKIARVTKIIRGKSFASRDEKLWPANRNNLNLWNKFIEYETSAEKVQSSKIVLPRKVSAAKIIWLRK